MELVGFQRKTPDGFIVLDQERDVADDTGGNGIREVVPHLTGIAAVTWYLELNLADYPVTRVFISTTQRKPEVEQYVSIANYATSAKIQAEDREGDEGFWLWNVLVTQLCKPVVSRHEEIVAADMALVVERRAVCHNRLGELPPDHLCTVVKTLPGPDGTPVQIQAHKLLRSTRELRIRLGPEEARPITMIVGDVPNRGPAVCVLYVWIEARHRGTSLNHIGTSKQLAQRMPKCNTNIPTKKSSGGGSRRLLPVAYLYTFSLPFGRGRTHKVAPSFEREKQVSLWCCPVS